MGRNFGFECEVSEGTDRVLRGLKDRDLIYQPRMHSYHCSCNACRPFNDRWSFHAQHDCTVDGEIILNVHEHGSERADRAIAGLADAMREARAMVHTNGGFHVHVSREDLTIPETVEVFRLFLRYQDDIGELASAKFPRVRTYNSPIGPVHREFWTAGDDVCMGMPLNYNMHPLWPGGRGSWLWATSYNTFEFRLWNSTMAEWRMRLAVGMSVAIVDAVKAGERVTQDDPRPFESVVGPYMDDHAWAGLIRQRYSKGGINAAA